MLYCVIELKSETASFRNPDFQNFHKTYRLPPPTSLIGLAGAALGLSPKAAQDFFEQEVFLAGVKGYSKGIARDLWKYDTLPGRSVITREILAKLHYRIVFGCESTELVYKIQEAFKNPAYALTMGTSDSLAKVIGTSLIESDTVHSELENTWVENDIVPQILAQAVKGGSFSLGVNDTDPMVFNLPTRFSYESDYGVRRVVSRKVFSLVGPKVSFVDQSFKGILVDDIFIPTFEL